jgi:hypothetical protein
MQQRDVLLGRYGVEKVVGLLVLAIVSGFYLYLAWSTEQNRRLRQFKTIALSFSIVMSLVVGDVFLRVVKSRQYIGGQSLYHRVPNQVQKGTFVDEPEKAFAYANMPAGYPSLEYTLTVDKRGFRNRTHLEKYDIVVLGDSFTEGSGVSDEHAWPVLLAERMGLSVYNLGMSGGNPVTYVHTLEKFGLPLEPKTVICMLYEGNDFRESNFENKDSFGKSLEEVFKLSPLRKLIKNGLIKLLATEMKLGTAESGADSQAAPGSWLPIAIPQGGKYYSFKVKSLLQHYHTPEQFKAREPFQKTIAEMRRIKDICHKNGARLIIVFAPDKPHALLPLIADTVTSAQLHDFMAVKEDNLPAPDETMSTMLEAIEVQETAVKDFCGAEAIEFVSVTEPLRKAIAEGKHAYFTYDQHWTPEGQKIAAGAIYDYLKGK